MQGNFSNRSPITTVCLALTPEISIILGLIPCSPKQGIYCVKKDENREVTPAELGICSSLVPERLTHTVPRLAPDAIGFVSQNSSC
jgi:hypothetical protein